MRPRLKWNEQSVACALTALRHADFDDDRLMNGIEEAKAVLKQTADDLQEDVKAKHPIGLYQSQSNVPLSRNNVDCSTIVTTARPTRSFRPKIKKPLPAIRDLVALAHHHGLNPDTCTIVELMRAHAPCGMNAHSISDTAAALGPLHVAARVFEHDTCPSSENALRRTALHYAIAELREAGESGTADAVILLNQIAEEIT